MAFVILGNDAERHHQALKYFEFFPTNEGQFDALRAVLNPVLSESAILRSIEESLNGVFTVNPADTRELLLWCLCMVMSRSLPLEFKHVLAQLAAGTSFVESVSHADGEFVQTAIPVLAPMIDMCNHSTYENVCVVGAKQGESAMLGLQALRDVTAGEELTMKYSPNSTELRVIWGMETVR
jgi:hypothetical protein